MTEDTPYNVTPITDAKTRKWSPERKAAWKARMMEVNYKPSRRQLMQQAIAKRAALTQDANHD